MITNVQLGLALLLAAACACIAFAQSPLRLAMLDLSGDERGEVAALLRATARESAFELIDEDLMRAAARGNDYHGGLNLDRIEARALGQSLGCDFYLLGKVMVGRRLAAGEQYYFEALAGVFVVEARSGRLVHFAFAQEQAGDETAAQRQLLTSLKRDWPRSVAAMQAARELRDAEVAAVGQAASEALIIEDDALGDGLRPAVFYQRLKPAYTREAELAGVTATVELLAVFGEDGRVGAVEVTRWAGFGLDEAALATVRQLRFKPAARDGKSVTIRGLVRYNFRRSPSMAEKLEDTERLKRSLRELQPPVTDARPRPRP